MSSGPGLGMGKGVRHEGNWGAGGRGYKTQAREGQNPRIHMPSLSKEPQRTLESDQQLPPMQMGPWQMPAPHQGASSFTFLQSLPLLIIRNLLTRVSIPPTHPGTTRVCPHPESTPYSAAGAGSASKAMGLSGAGGSSSLGHPIPEQAEKTGAAGSQSQRGSKRVKKERKGEGRRKGRAD